MKKIGQGKYAEVFDLGNGQILKLFFPEKRSQLEAEFHIHKKVMETGYPIAEARQIIHLDGRDGILFDNSVVGPSMNQVIWKSPWKLLKMARMLADIHAHIHTFKAPQLPRFTDRLYTQLTKEQAFTPAIHTYLSDKIERLPVGDTLCHGDLHLNNVILNSKKPFVIDWCRASKGNPLCDVAKTIIVSQLENVNDSAAYRLCLKPLWKLFIQAYVSRYEKVTGLNTSSLKEIMEPIEIEILLRKEPEHRNRIIKRTESRYQAFLENEHEITK